MPNVLRVKTKRSVVLQKTNSVYEINSNTTEKRNMEDFRKPTESFTGLTNKNNNVFTWLQVTVATLMDHESPQIFLLLSFFI